MNGLHGLGWLSPRLGQAVTDCYSLSSGLGAEQSAGARGARGARCWSHYLDTVSMTLMADTLTVMKLPEISSLLRLWTVKLLAVPLFRVLEVNSRPAVEISFHKLADKKPSLELMVCH